MTDQIGKLTKADWNSPPVAATHVSLDGKTFYKRFNGVWHWWNCDCIFWVEMLATGDFVHSLISKEGDLGVKKYEG